MAHRRWWDKSEGRFLMNVIIPLMTPLPRGRMCPGNIRTNGGLAMRQAQGLAALVLGALIALAANASARAQCSFGCNRYVQGQCVEYRTCTPGLSALPPSYGAIAYGRKSRAWGHSYHWGSQAKAESLAMQNCAKHGDDCEIMVWFKRKCGAVVSAEGSVAYWGLGDSEAQARAEAQSQCVKEGGKNCEVEVSQCSK
jgi:hypothetical protein